MSLSVELKPGMKVKCMGTTWVVDFIGADTILIVKKFCGIRYRKEYISTLYASTNLEVLGW